MYSSLRRSDHGHEPQPGVRKVARAPLLKQRSAWLLALIACMTAVTAGAQTVQGHVTDHQTGQGVADATVLLLNEDGAIRNMSLTDATGAYSIVAPGTGRYSLRVDAAGYNTLNGDVFLVPAGRTLDVDLEIWSLTELEPVVVEAEEEPFAPGPLAGFYERMEGARGEFLSREDIEMKGATRFTEILRLVPGVAIVPLRGSQYTVRMKGTTRLAGDCPPELWVDNTRWGSIDIGDGPDRELFPSDIEGIEVYTPSRVPAEFASGNSMCGAIVVWTKRAP